MKAKFEGRCTACGLGYMVGSEINRCPSGWAHSECADIVVETGRIRSGVTYRSQAPSSYRVGSSPGSKRNRA